MQTHRIIIIGNMVIILTMSSELDGARASFYPKLEFYDFNITPLQQEGQKQED